MLKFEDLVFDWTTSSNRDAHIGVVLGIDGKVQYLLHTYLNVYELLTSGNALQDATDKYNDGDHYVEVYSGETIIETLQLPELVWALLLSDCVIIEIGRYSVTPKTYEEMGDLYYVAVGWLYQLVNGSYEVTPPADWAPPVKKTLQEQLAYQVDVIQKLTFVLENNPDSDQYYVDLLSSANDKKAALQLQIEAENGQQ